MADAKMADTKMADAQSLTWRYWNVVKWVLVTLNSAQLFFCYQIPDLQPSSTQTSKLQDVPDTKLFGRHGFDSTVLLPKM